MGQLMALYLFTIWNNVRSLSRILWLRIYETMSHCLVPRVGGGGGGGSVGKIYATIITMLLHSWLSLIWYATWPCSEKVEFRPIDPIPRWVGVSVRKIFAIMLLQAWFSLICNMTCSEKVEFWPFDPIPKPKITFDMFHICSTVSLSVPLSIDPIPRMGGATMLLHLWFSLVWYAT